MTDKIQFRPQQDPSAALGTDCKSPGRHAPATSSRGTCDCSHHEPTRLGVAGARRPGRDRQNPIPPAAGSLRRIWYRLQITGAARPSYIEPPHPIGWIRPLARAHKPSNCRSTPSLGRGLRAASPSRKASHFHWPPTEKSLRPPTPPYAMPRTLDVRFPPSPPVDSPPPTFDDHPMPALTPSAADPIPGGFPRARAASAASLSPRDAA